MESKKQDLFQAIETNFQNIQHFESKNGKQTAHLFFNGESFNGSNLALWQFGQVRFQGRLREKAQALRCQI